MSKVLIINDIHLRDKAPSSATDSYVDDLFDLLEQTVKLEKELKVDAVVWAGDVFDHKSPSKTSHRLMLRTIDLANRYKNLWVIAGNHDLTQDRLSTLFDQQPLGVLLKGSQAHYLDGWHDSLPLYGVHWQQDWMDEEARSAAFEAWRQADDVVTGPVKYSRDLDKSLVVTHAPIYPPGQEHPMSEHVPLESLSKAMGNVGYVTYGHIHEDHGIFEVDNVIYANHGAISRGSLQEYNRHRAIQVTLWDSEEGFSSVELDFKPAEEVFRLTEIDEQKSHKISLDEFLADVGKTTIGISTTESVIAHLSGRTDIEQNVKKTAVELVEAES